MSFVKSKLKLARDALGKKDYQSARDAANQVLEYEPENYNATVFLGLASLELGDLETSEQAYRKAIDANPTGILAWQGISKFYERTLDGEKFLDALRRIAEIYAQNNDVTKCAETIQKYIDIRRGSGSRKQIVEALCLLLPDSTFYPILSNLPPPDPSNPTSTAFFTIQSAIHNSLPVLEEIVDMVEKDEAESIKKDVENRRLRLGEARSPEQLRKAVDFEILGASQLPRLYDEILNHPNTSDDFRRSTEAKLLRHKQRYLYAIPISAELAELKAKIAGELESLVNGAVLLGIPDELAWNLYIDGKDCDTIEGYDFPMLRRFQELFPSLPLTSFVNAYFAYSCIQVAMDDDDQENKTIKEDLNMDDVLDTILDAFSSLHDSIFANRVLADVYLREIDYPNAIKIAESGLELINRSEANYGKKLPQVKKAFNVILSTSLVHFYPPKHHPRALRIIDDVLGQDSGNIACLMARGYILEAAGRWIEARKFFARVVDLVSDDLEDGLRALEEQAWCQIQLREYQNGMDCLKSVLESLNGFEDRNLDQARCLWRLGKCHWDLCGDKREEAYRFFIQSLKKSPGYAPAFTSLGIYYLECANPPDPNRATKCFQKAFELDAREAEAARRLAEGFAEEREWDLVEVVARRTIDGEGGVEAGTGTNEDFASGRYLPTNSWAWKAVGIVELVHRNYENAIRALQVALRADPGDHLSWLRLGEAYSKAGRHAAAMKALGRARELMPEDWMCLYFIGEVQQQVGQYQDAIDSFTSVIVHRPAEVGVLMSLAQAHLELGRVEMSSGFSSRAEQSFIACVRASLQAIAASPGFRAVAWKTAADAVYDLSDCPSFKVESPRPPELAEISSLLAVQLSDRLSGIISSSTLHNIPSLDEHQVLSIAVSAYDYRVSLTSSGSHSFGTAWYDLGIALHAWSQKSLSPEGKIKANQQAISCLKEALRQEPGNTLYWNALGTLNFEEPKVSQHSYIKALEIDSKDVVTWTNLGLLYLHHGDTELANEAFYRAQTLDPDYQVAWIGQALVATAHGHHAEADAMLEHAVNLPTIVPGIDFELASRIFSGHSNRNQRSALHESLFLAFFVLDRYCRQRLNDASAQQLHGLICERIGQIELGIEHTRRAITILEAAYEETEDPVVEQQFTIATSNLARMLLCVHDYVEALEAFGSVLGLLPENDDDERTNIMRVQAHFGSGLANFHLGNLDEALAMFEAALEAARDNLVIKGQVTVLLAQTLWAMGTEEYRESAKSQLLQSINDYPENLAAINALAGMGIVTEDGTLIDAALSEILSLPLDQRHELDPSRDVDYLLTQHHLGMGDIVQALSVAQKAVHAEPARPENRRDVASLLIQLDEFRPALAVFAGLASEGDVDARREVGGLRAIAESLVPDAESLNKEVALRQAQHAVKLSPSQSRDWKILAFVRAQGVE